MWRLSYYMIDVYEMKNKGVSVMKENPMVTANALAATIGIFYVVCRVLVSLFPGFMFSIAQSWVHDIKLTELNSATLSLSSFLLGLVSSVAVAWTTGYLYARIHNLMKSS